MSLRVVLSNRFKKDLKLAKKRGLDLELLNSVVTQLASGNTLEAKYRDHDLGGNYTGFRECHIKPDWLLIYRIDGNRLILFLNRTGSHADLLNKTRPRMTRNLKRQAARQAASPKIRRPDAVFVRFLTPCCTHTWLHGVKVTENLEST